MNDSGGGGEGVVGATTLERLGHEGVGEPGQHRAAGERHRQDLVAQRLGERPPGDHGEGEQHGARDHSPITLRASSPPARIATDPTSASGRLEKKMRTSSASDASSTSETPSARFSGTA